jgi:hypothetical protein
MPDLEDAMATRSQVLRKDQILSNLATIRQHILTAASGLSEPQADPPFLGIWSVKDLVAHLIGWDLTNLSAVKSLLKGNLPAFYKYRDHDWQTYNAILVRKHRRDTLTGTLAAARNSHETLIDFLQTLPPENFDKDFGVRFRGYRVTIQRLLQAETRDEETHYRQIVDSFKTSG